MGFGHVRRGAPRIRITARICALKCRRYLPIGQSFVGYWVISFCYFLYETSAHAGRERKPGPVAGGSPLLQPRPLRSVLSRPHPQEEQNYGLDPLFMFSVIRQESLFEGFVQSTA